MMTVLVIITFPNQIRKTWPAASRLQSRGRPAHRELFYFTVKLASVFDDSRCSAGPAAIWVMREDDSTPWLHIT